MPFVPSARGFLKADVVSESLFTLYDAPFCLPPQDPLAVHLVLLVAAYDRERVHFLLSVAKSERAIGQRPIPQQLRVLGAAGSP